MRIEVPASRTGHCMVTGQPLICAPFAFLVLVVDDLIAVSMLTVNTTKLVISSCSICSGVML